MYSPPPRACVKVEARRLGEVPANLTPTEAAMTHCAARSTAAGGLACVKPAM